MHVGQRVHQPGGIVQVLERGVPVPAGFHVQDGGGRTARSHVHPPAGQPERVFRPLPVQGEVPPHALQCAPDQGFGKAEAAAVEPAPRRQHALYGPFGSMGKSRAFENGQHALVDHLQFGFRERPVTPSRHPGPYRSWIIAGTAGLREFPPLPPPGAAPPPSGVLPIVRNHMPGNWVGGKFM